METMEPIGTIKATETIEPDVKIYHDNFVDETINLKKYLMSIKGLCDEYDKRRPPLQNQIKYIESIKDEFFMTLDIHFFIVWEISRRFSEEEMLRHRKYYQKELMPFFQLSPYNKRVYDKPLGYAGDYVMMIYLYEDGYEGDSTFAKLIHRYSMHVPAARANHNRKDFYKMYINNSFIRSKTPRITSIASGPAVEIIEFLNDSPFSNAAKITCLDFEKKALEYVKKVVDEMELTRRTKYKINYINANIINMLRKKYYDVLDEDQDLIYSSGLIDYFNDHTALKMIEALFNKLKKNGILIVGNVSTGNQHRAFTEILGEWYINHRSEGDMLRLAEKINGEKNVQIEYEKETKMNIFMIITKL